MAKLEMVEGIGTRYTDQLRAAGVRSTKSLLEKGGTPAGRQEIAQAAGISAKLVLEWVNHVDLFRIKGVGEEYADLLEEAGVDTVVELAQRNAANLYQAIVETNAQKNLVRRPPSKKMVHDWVEIAKKLPRKVHY
jgi:predicted flap endonuclease-1-like 5' DNA nuclease